MQPQPRKSDVAHTDGLQSTREGTLPGLNPRITAELREPNKQRSSQPSATFLLHSSCAAELSSGGLNHLHSDMSQDLSNYTRDSATGLNKLSDPFLESVVAVITDRIHYVNRTEEECVEYATLGFTFPVSTADSQSA